LSWRYDVSILVILFLPIIVNTYNEIAPMMHLPCLYELSFVLIYGLYL